MNENQARDLHYTTREYLRKLDSELAMAKAVADYCDFAEAVGETGLPDLALDAKRIGIGEGLVLGAPLTGPLAPISVTVGGAFIAIGLVGLASHSSSLLTNYWSSGVISTNGIGSSFDSVYSSPQGSRKEEYVKGKVADHFTDRFSRHADSSFPGLDECKALHDEIKAVAPRIEQKIKEVTPPPAPNRPTIGPPKQFNPPSIPSQPKITIPLGSSSDGGWSHPDHEKHHDNFAGGDAPTSTNSV